MPRRNSKKRATPEKPTEPVEEIEDFTADEAPEPATPSPPRPKCKICFVKLISHDPDVVAHGVCGPRCLFVHLEASWEDLNESLRQFKDRTDAELVALQQQMVQLKADMVACSNLRAPQAKRWKGLLKSIDKSE
jgi:hypothetical protein